MSTVEARLVYWQHRALTALSEAEEARSAEIARLIGLPAKRTYQIMIALLRKGLVEVERRPDTHLELVAHYRLSSGGYTVLRSNPDGPAAPVQRASYGRSAEWLLTVLLMHYPQRYLSVAALGSLARVSRSMTADYIASWAKIGYVVRSELRRGIYRLTPWGAVYAQSQQTRLYRREIAVLAAFRADTEFGHDLAGRAHISVRDIKKVLLRLAEDSIVQRSSVRVPRPNIGLAAYTYTLTLLGLELRRDPRVRQEFQNQSQTYQAARLAVRQNLRARHPHRLSPATLVARTGLAAETVVSILADLTREGLISAERNRLVHVGYFYGLATATPS